MRRLLKLAALALAALFAGLQFVRPERTNARIDPARALEARTRVTPEVSALLARSCDDCHTERTRWPWYSEIAPVSWYVAAHVRDGRRSLNLSDWVQYQGQDVDGLLAGICGEARRGTMPPPSYARLHPSARLTPRDIQIICDWTAAERRRLEK